VLHDNLRKLADEALSEQPVTCGSDADNWPVCAVFAATI
jgi:hypothetical protein